MLPKGSHFTKFVHVTCRKRAFFHARSCRRRLWVIPSQTRYEELDIRSLSIICTCIANVLAMLTAQFSLYFALIDEP